MPQGLSLPVLAGCLWVLLGAITAMMPMRRQGWTGVPLLLAAPVLIVWLGWAHGWWWSALGLFAFGSMFRRPLIALWCYLSGRPIPYPPGYLEARAAAAADKAARAEARTRARAGARDRAGGPVA